jgi:hypothetical protein
MANAYGVEVMLSERKRQKQWQKGAHEDGNGKLWSLDEMTETHLRNTIKAFTELDTGPLRKELRRRSRLKLREARRILRRKEKLKRTSSQRRRASKAKKASRALSAYLKQK